MPDSEVTIDYRLITLVSWKSDDLVKKIKDSEHVGGFGVLVMGS
jgi:hypothetical protein